MGTSANPKFDIPNIGLISYLIRQTRYRSFLLGNNQTLVEQHRSSEVVD